MPIQLIQYRIINDHLIGQYLCNVFMRRKIITEASVETGIQPININVLTRNP